MYNIMLATVLSYLVGCICFGYYIVKFTMKKNLHDCESGNIGATNAGRILGKKGFIIVFILDFLKGITGFLIVGIYEIVSPWNLVISALTIVGHIWPVQLKFKGGKGISTFLGFLFFYDYKMFLWLALLFIPIFLKIKNFSISGLFSICFLPGIAMLLHKNIVDIFLIITIIIIIIFAHRDNIQSYRINLNI